ncbi:M57 family metalloprotease [Fulvivirga sediminis]|uniref:Peptidase metallopeptidase domain-containing protein n=1 Tax=Fulvivirga sediminis TaxID=2803949 RepID=A0A937JZI8_9BACT|nr:M57 family metalloprotease [Fulvivirga sediminis]MBL3657443.1 hypothetical protein [Fulvivirga sediminis]
MIVTIKRYFNAYKYLSLILFFGLYSCAEEGEVKPNIDDKLPSDKLEKYYSYLKETGLKESEFAYNEAAQAFIIGGDVVMPLTHIDAYLEGGKNPSKVAKEAQKRTQYLVNSRQGRDIRVYIHPNVPAGWRKATVSAMKEWTNVEDCFISFREVSSSNDYDVLVSVEPTSTFDENTVAYAFYPYNGYAGNWVKINPKFNNYSASYKKNTMGHELGHTIGLAHPSDDTGIYIEGTPYMDDNSIMYSWVDRNFRLTDGDRKAVQILY